MTRKFKWYHVQPDGTADVYEDGPDICARVDRERGWFGSPEGLILHGGVKASAFRRQTQKMYDAAAFFATGALIETGEVTTTHITAEAMS